MELLASINRPTRSGRSVSAARLMSCLGGRLLSRILNSFCFKSLTNLLCLSSTVKITFTSLIWVWNVCAWPSSLAAEGAVPGDVAFAAGGTVVCGTAEVAGCVIAGCVCATAKQQTRVKENKTANTLKQDMAATLFSVIIVRSFRTISFNIVQSPSFSVRRSLHRSDE